jgi:hypothetical protein
VPNEQNAEFAEIWRAAQHRRTADLARWRNHFLKPNDKMPIQSRFRPRRLLAHAVVTAVIALAAFISVSALVDAKKPLAFVLRPTGPMPAVNVP